jgi:hypothetical protein
LTQEKASAFMFLHLLGIMASCLQMILNARLFMRPVTSFEFLETKFAQPHCTNSIYSTSEITSHLVVKFSEHAERPIFSISKNVCSHNNRCFEKGFWRFHERTNFSGKLDACSEQMLYKLSRYGSSFSDHETFSSSDKRAGRSYQVGQHG